MPIHQTDRPFHQALAELKAKRRLSFRQLSDATRRIDPSGRGLSSPYIWRIVHGEKVPTVATIALVANALDLPPAYFAECRLAAARDRLDERVRGLKPALDELRRIERSGRRSRAAA